MNSRKSGNPKTPIYFMLYDNECLKGSEKTFIVFLAANFNVVDSVESRRAFFSHHSTLILIFLYDFL